MEITYVNHKKITLRLAGDFLSFSIFSMQLNGTCSQGSVRSKFHARASSYAEAEGMKINRKVVTSILPGNNRPVGCSMNESFRLSTGLSPVKYAGAVLSVVSQPGEDSKDAQLVQA